MDDLFEQNENPGDVSINETENNDQPKAVESVSEDPTEALPQNPDPNPAEPHFQYQDSENADDEYNSTPLENGTGFVSENGKTTETEYRPYYNPVNYSPVNKIDDYRPMSKGLKIFSVILAVLILMTGSCAAGYFIGKKSNVFIGSHASKVDLADKPKDTDEMTPAEVFEKVNKSIVGITVYNEKGEGAQASGIVFSKDGYIISNDHIYTNIASPKIMIHFYDGSTCKADFVAGDIISDLSVLKAEKGGLTPAVFGDSDQLFSGQNVVAIGRPSDSTDTSSITKGIISALNRRVRNSSNYSARLIQTDCPINPGSSGGALVNMYGQVIGVTSSKMANSADFEGIGYAIPTTVMKRVADDLIAEKKVVSRARLGITYTAVDDVYADMQKYDNTGLLVSEVSEDSDLYGKIKSGDFITHINDIEVTSDKIVLDIIEDCVPGDKITITVVTSDGSSKNFEAKLKANVGESCYNKVEKSSSENNSGSIIPGFPDTSSGGGTFNFPSGE